MDVIICSGEQCNVLDQDVGNNDMKALRKSNSHHFITVKFFNHVELLQEQILSNSILLYQSTLSSFASDFCFVSP